MQVESDEPLDKLGMYIETDRKYLLLQLSRIRDRKRIARRRLQAEDSGSSCQDLCLSLLNGHVCLLQQREQCLEWPWTRQDPSLMA